MKHQLKIDFSLTLPQDPLPPTQLEQVTFYQNLFHKFSTFFEGEYDTLQERAQSSLAHQRLHNCRVLQRNFNACVDAAQTNLDPSMRTRYNEPISETSEFPHVRDLGLFTRNVFETQASSILDG